MTATVTVTAAVITAVTAAVTAAVITVVAPAAAVTAVVFVLRVVRRHLRPSASAASPATCFSVPQVAIFWPMYGLPTWPSGCSQEALAIGQ